MKNPKVTVLMPVYNGEKYLHEAIDSILSQTFEDFEFLILNDGSTDNSVKIIENYRDKRIKLLHNEKNLGLVTTLNKGIDMSSGEYIARMDCDDISMPERLSKQVSFMDANSNIGVCGSWVSTIGTKDRCIWKYSIDDKLIRCEMFWGTAMAHPSVIMRKSLINSYGIRYDINYTYVEDYEFWLRLLHYTSFANIPEFLLLYRLHEKNTDKLAPFEQERRTSQIRINQLYNLGINPSDNEINLHNAIALGKINYNKEFISDIHSWLCKLTLANEQISYYPEPFFSKLIGEHWFFICKESTGLGMWIWTEFWKSPLSKVIKLSLFDQIKFLIKSSLRFKKKLSLKI